MNSEQVKTGVCQIKVGLGSKIKQEKGTVVWRMGRGGEGREEPQGERSNQAKALGRCEHGPQEGPVHSGHKSPPAWGWGPKGNGSRGRCEERRDEKRFHIKDKMSAVCRARELA